MRTSSILVRLGLVALLGAVVAGVAIGFWLARRPDPLLGTLADAIRRAQTVELYEGVPRCERTPGRTSLTQDVGSAELLIRENRFYREPLRARAGDAAALAAIFGNSSSFRTITMAKGCKAFHADFAVEWKTDGQSFSVLICFGCGELLVVTPDGVKAFDQSGNADWDLLALLRRYSARDPESERALWRDQNPDGTTVSVSDDTPVQLESIRGVTRWGSRLPN